HPASLRVFSIMAVCECQPGNSWDKHHYPCSAQKSMHCAHPDQIGVCSFLPLCPVCNVPGYDGVGQQEHVSSPLLLFFLSPRSVMSRCIGRGTNADRNYSAASPEADIVLRAASTVYGILPLWMAFR